MQANAPLAIFLICISVVTVCGCIYGDEENAVSGFDQPHDELNISEPVAISLEEAENSFASFSRECLHRDPTGSIMKIIGFRVGADGKAMNWIFGTVFNNDQEYYEINSQGITPMIWEIPLPEDAIEPTGIVDIRDAIMTAGHADGERTVTISGGEITITTKTEEDMAVSVISAYSGDLVI